MEMIDQIAAIPLFDGLPRKDLEDLAMIVLSQRIRRGQIIFAEGDEGKAKEITLTRHDRYRILYRTAEIIRSRGEAISDLITAECGICKKDSLYEVGRACDVFVFAGNAALNDDGQIFSCDLTPHGKKRRIFTQRDPLLGVISAITPRDIGLTLVLGLATLARVIVLIAIATLIWVGILAWLMLSS